jgi:hypothetical protein
LWLANLQASEQIRAQRIPLMVRLILIAVLVSALSGCHSTVPGISSEELSKIFADRRAKGAFVGIRDASPKQYAVEFATPDPPNVGSVYKYETFMIGKKDLDPVLRVKIDLVAINPAGGEEPKKDETKKEEFGRR